MSNNDNNELSGLLADLREQGDGFRTPAAGYFEDLADRSIKAGRQPARTVGINRKWLGLAASVVLLFIATVLFWPEATATGPIAEENRHVASDDILAEIDASDIEAYIADNLDNFESELYAAETSNPYPNE